MKIEALLESVLYVAGEEGVSLVHLTELLNMPIDEVEQMIEKLEKRYQQDPMSGLVLLFVADRIVLAAKKEAEPFIRKYAQSPYVTPLSKAALEILAIVAYKQPITRVEIDLIRGVQSGGSVQKLLLRGLVKSMGRVDGPGRPVLYGTTNYFLNYFGLDSIESLPELPESENQLEGLDLFTGADENQK